MTAMTAAALAASLALSAAAAGVTAAPVASSPGNASQYSVVWPSLLPEPGKNKAGGATFLNSMPLGNGHVVANILYDSESKAVVALVAAASAWAEDGELIKVGLLEVKLAPGVVAEGASAFSQALDPQTATWTLVQGGQAVAWAFIDANSDTLVVRTHQPSAPALKALRVDKASGVGPSSPPFSCQPYTVSPDHNGTSEKVQWVLHHNANVSGANDYMATTLAGENIPQDPRMPNPLLVAPAT